MNLSALHQQHPDLAILTQLLVEAGGQPYLVGGSVRDLCLGTIPKDLDIEVSSLSRNRLVRALSTRYDVDQVGKKFGVFILRGLPFDIALPRMETQTGPKHTDFEIEYDPDLPLERAAARRDFTLNAIYLDLKSGELIDPHGGLEDLARRHLRHTSHQFAEDPLRVLRAMQFIARFDLSCEPATVELCRTMSLSDLPRERIWEEFKKLILLGAHIRKGLHFLHDAGGLSHFPELEALVGCEQDPQWHPEGDVWTHTLLAMDAFAKRRIGSAEEDLIVGLAVLCHDMGKPLTSFREQGRIRSPRHEKEGVPVAERFLQRLTRDQRILQDVPPLVREHMVPHQLYATDASDAALRRLALRVGRVDRLLRVCQADREGRLDPWQPLPFPEGEWAEKRFEALQLKSSKPKPLILGRDLIQKGLTPGPHFSEILQSLFDAQLEGHFTTRESGLTYLDQWLHSHKP